MMRALLHAIDIDPHGRCLQWETDRGLAGWAWRRARPNCLALPMLPAAPHA